MADRFKQGSYHAGRRFAYQVFLSFRGEDVRKGFVDHLHHALVQNGIRTFHDESKLERGADIQSKLYEGIQSSELSIVTFSSSYATSRWCLDELVKIMERRTSNNHVVLPIFYDVDPTVVRNQSGVFARAFNKLEVRFKEDLDRVKKWREALRAAADVAGFFLKNQADGHEAKFIQNIVKEVRKKLDRRRLNVSRNVVGVESIVEDITKWLRDGSKHVEVGWIYGLGGAGKTTITKIAYNDNCDNFDGYSFLANVRGVSKEYNGFIRLQRQLIYDISGDEVGEIHNISEGMIKICKVIGSRRIMLVIDDVDELEQLHGMFNHPEWFFPGSKIIVTTRNQHLGNVYMPIHKFQVCTLNVEQSTQLFCLCAFGRDYPLQGYMKVLEQFIQYFDGLPLALEVLASSLCGKALELWESQLAKLEDFPNRKIHKVLELSFDSIEDDNDKDIFLHIAFFLVGVREDYAFKILEGCGFHTKIGFQNLMDRCLVTIDGFGNVMMHQLIQEMGREVVRHEDDKMPGRRSRLWNHKETCNVLRNKEGTSAIKGLRLAFLPPKSDQIYEDNYIKAKHLLKNIGLSWIHPTHSRRVHINLESVKTDAFIEMKNMNLLQLENVQLKGHYEDFPKGLNCLWWHGCPLETIPGDFDLSKLVVLDMRNSCLIHAWEGIKFLGALKILNLSNSPFLTDTPDFSSALALEWIILIDCISLVTIHQSIGRLRNLTHLNLKGCKYLRRLPNSMSELKSLEMLDLSGCSQLLKAPPVSMIRRAGTASLKVLYALGSSMQNINGGSGFVFGAAPRGNKVYILAFEVANTIAKGANLMQSLSEENMEFMKKEILQSEGVQRLVSTDMNYLLNLAADDKREELDVFSREVIRFGDLRNDPQWHNLGLFFSKFDSYHTHKLEREEAEATLQKLTNLAEHTSELYHELNALDRTAHDYRRKLEETEALHLPTKGESFSLLESELKQQKKVVRSLKKKSLWSKSLEKIVERLVDVVTFIQQEILIAFGGNDGTLIKKVSEKNTPKLGAAGLALHYANVINQIDNIASRPASLPVNVRDTLYQGLPVSVKVTLRSQLQAVDDKKERTIVEVKAEMEKTLEWLVPIAANTTKAHQGFGWVGEWANTGNDFNSKTSANQCLIRLQTLYHADQQKTDLYILKLVTWLHHLITLVRHRDYTMKPHVTIKSPIPNPKITRAASLTESHRAHLSQEERSLLADVCGRRPVPTKSKSQEFSVIKKKGSTVWALSKSTGSSPRRNFGKTIELADALDKMDGLEPTF